MKLIVWKVAGWKPINFGSKKGMGDYLRVAFKKYDGSKGTVYLNLPEVKLYGRCVDWLPYLKEGNILDCQVQPNGTNVNYYSPFTIIDVKEGNKVK